MNLLVHNEVIRDRNGNIEYIDKEKGIAALRPDPIKECQVYIDDLAISTGKLDTEEASLKEHFRVVEQVIKRVSDNNAKINVSKCKFAEKKMVWLGYEVSNGRISPDPRRIEKILKAEMPKTLRQARGVAGLLNTLRRLCPLPAADALSTFFDLIKPSQKFKVEQRHRDAFEKIKTILTQKPVFANTWIPAANL